MRSNLFNEYLDSIIAQGLSKKKKAEIRTEFENHLQDKTDWYIEIGYGEDEATQKAVAEMGESAEVRDKLYKIYEGDIIRKNTVKTYSLHIIISILFIPIFFVVNVFNSGNLYISIILFSVSTVFYFFTGRFFLKNVESRTKNSFSIWSLSIFILLITLLVLFHDKLGIKEWFEGSNFVLFIASNPFYIFSYLTMGIYLNNTDIVNFVIYKHLILLAMLPSTFLWLGMFTQKRKYQKEKVQTKNKSMKGQKL